MMMMMMIMTMTSLLYFIYFIYFALKPHLLSSGLKREAKNQHLSLSREHEKRWGGVTCSSSYLSLNKSVWWRQQPFSLCSLLLPFYLSAAQLCLTVRVLVEHGSPDTFDISCSLLCELSRLWERQKEWQYHHIAHCSMCLGLHQFCFFFLP